MAYTKFLTRKTRLDWLINYAMNGEKTEKMMYVSGLNCRPETAYQEMQNTKKRFNKESGVVSYHLIQSFKGHEVSPEKCHELGVKYAKELFGDEFECIVATHLNTDNVHNHIIVNSVSFKTGYKFNSNRETRDYIKITSDFICKENNLSVITTPWKYKGYYKLYAKNNPYLQSVKSDVDYAIDTTLSYRDFENKLKKQGYFVSYNENTGIAISRDNNYKVVRLQELFGSNYTKEKIIERVEDFSKNRPVTYFSSRPQKVYKMNVDEYNKFIEKQRQRELKKLPALYVLICLLLRIDPLPKKLEIGKYKLPITKEIKIASKYMDELSKQAILLSKNNIENLNELQNFRYKLEDNLRILKGKREGLWRKRKRAKTSEEKENITAEISVIKSQIDKVSNDIMNCYEIENRSLEIQKQLDICKEHQLNEKNKSKSKSREL